MEKRPTVCIIYGFCEGQGLGKRFRAELERAGFDVIRNAKTADVIITHSGGCFMLPKELQAKKIIHIGVGHDPKRRLSKAIPRKVISDFLAHKANGNLRGFARKSAWNALYMLKLPRHIRMLRASKQGGLWQCDIDTLIVRPRDDAFATPNASDMPFVRPASFLSIPGQHDDCWTDPAPYVAIVQSSYGTRVLG